MSLRKRKGSAVWHVDIRTPGGGRIRQTAGTTDKREAQEFHDKLKHEAWRSTKLGEKPKHTFDEAALRFLREHEETADYRTKVRHIRYWRAIFRGRNLETILRDEIMDALPQTVARGGQPKPTSASTRNRYLSTIRTMLKLAANQWEWINRVPQLAEAREPRVRIRWITREEAQRLLGAITEGWIREITVFGFATGLRQANILGLEWSQVDLAKRRAWIHPDQAKARKPIGVPLNSDAVAVLRRQIGKHATRVFVRDGEPIVRWSDFRWETACCRTS